jgi:hypothetical protein
LNGLKLQLFFLFLNRHSPPLFFVVGVCVCALFDESFFVAGFPAAAYAAYAAGRGYSGYPSFGLPYPAGNTLASLHHHHHPLPLLPYPLDHLGMYGGTATAASLHAMPL